MILRIDVDRPYGKRGFVRHVASRVSLRLLYAAHESARLSARPCHHSRNHSMSAANPLTYFSGNVPIPTRRSAN